MKTLTTAFAVLLGMAAATAQAGPYDAAIDACHTAISEHLDIAKVPTNYDLQKVRSKARYKDLSFSVSAYDDANPVQRVKVSCRARSNGEVLALEIDPDTLPTALATQ